MCWGTSSSRDNSLIVRRAPGSFCPAEAKALALCDPVAHDLAGAEGHDPARGDRHFDPRLRVTADTLALIAQDESTEAGNLRVLALGQGVAHVVQDSLDNAGGL